MAARRWITLCIITLCGLLSLSCITPCFLSGRQAPTPIPTVSASEDAAKQLEGKVEGLGSAQFRLEITEQEATSYLALRAASSFPLHSPQVHFLPGKIIAEGDISNPVRGHLVATARVSVVDGRPEIQVLEARLGAVSAPQALLASLSDGVSEMIDQGEPAVVLDEIDVQAGRIVIVGHRS